ncbi:FABP5 protein, partial [Panurus biarmicus]|nr:FABP5 protein [Panurus biarmicus]
MAIDAFLGKWCLVSSEGFEEYMKELGKKPAAPRPREGGRDAGMPPRGSSVLAKCHGKILMLRFFFQTLVSLKDDGSLIQEQEWDGKKTTITRKLVDGQLVVECDMNGVKCVRVYQKA